MARSPVTVPNHLTQVAQQHGELGADAAGILSSRLVSLYHQVWVTIKEGYVQASTGGRMPGDGERWALG